MSREHNWQCPRCAEVFKDAAAYSEHACTKTDVPTRTCYDCNRQRKKCLACRVKELEERVANLENVDV